MGRTTNYLTADGKQLLERELHELVSTRRPVTIDAIHDAQADGDVDDSGIKDVADELIQIDDRIRAINDLLRHAEILPAVGTAVGDGIIRIGSRVTVNNADGMELTLLIVGSAEANPRMGKISDESPVGKALLGQTAGDTVTVRVLARDLTYCVMRVI